MDTDEVGSITPLPGGWSGRTFVAEVAGTRSVVRIYPPNDPRGPDAPEVDAAVMHLVRGLIPVPEVLEVRLCDTTAPGLLVTAWESGVRGDVALATLTDSGPRRVLGASMGRVAAILAGMPTPRAGWWAGPDLAIEPFDADLPGWVASHAGRLPAWSSAEIAALEAVALDAGQLLDGVGRTCVVHSDLNPKNVLIADGGEVSCVLDWEYSHSGHPMTDLGNVLRFDRDPDYADAALAAYGDLRGGTRTEALDLARSADLWALVELAARGATNTVVERARVLLRQIARAGDIHAWPDAW